MFWSCQESFVHSSACDFNRYTINWTDLLYECCWFWFWMVVYACDRHYYYSSNSLWRLDLAIFTYVIISFASSKQICRKYNVFSSCSTVLYAWNPCMTNAAAAAVFFFITLFLLQFILLCIFSLFFAFHIAHFAHFMHSYRFLLSLFNQSMTIGIVFFFSLFVFSHLFATFYGFSSFHVCVCRCLCFFYQFTRIRQFFDLLFLIKLVTFLLWCVKAIFSIRMVIFLFLF